MNINRISTTELASSTKLNILTGQPQGIAPTTNNQINE